MMKHLIKVRDCHFSQRLDDASIDQNSKLEDSKDLLDDDKSKSNEEEKQNMKAPDMSSKRQKTGEDEEKPVVKSNEKTFTSEEMVKIRNQLRIHKQPIKLFGESDYQTYIRLCILEQDDKAEIMQGQEQNIFSQKERDTNLTEFQRSLRDKLENKKPIDLVIGEQKSEDVIEMRYRKRNNEFGAEFTIKEEAYPDYK